VTIRFLRLLLEGSLIQLLETEGTDEMFRVKLLSHSGDASTRDGLLASRAK